MRVSELITVGETITRESAEQFLTDRLAEVIEASEEQARVAELLGHAKATRLKHAVVGIVGCSGTGSPAVHVLARAGVGRFVLVDPDCFTKSNHERFHGSTWRDLDKKELKVNLLRRFILDINPNAEIIPLRGNILDDGVLDELLRCDLVLGCTDTQHSRAALSDFASHYLLPSLDVAVLMRAKAGRLNEQVGEFARYSPDEPCAWCLGRIDQKVLSFELMSKEEREQRAQAAAEAVRRGIDGEQYWGGTPPRELTVGYMTTSVGSMLAGYAQGWLTGSFCMPHQRFQFDLGMPLLGAVPAEKARDRECSCCRTKGWSDQARADRSVSRPTHWPNKTLKSEAVVVVPSHVTHSP